MLQCHIAWLCCSAMLLYHGILKVGIFEVDSTSVVLRHVAVLPCVAMQFSTEHMSVARLSVS